MASVAALAVRAQNIRGPAHPLGGVSQSAQWKVEMNSVDNLVYASVNGGAWVAVFGGTGVIVTLDQAYDGGGSGAGRTITVDAGAVQMTNGQTTGVVLQVNSNAVTLTGTLTGLSVDLSAITGGLTNAGIGISVTGCASTVAKGTTSATANALITVLGRARNQAAIQTFVRNKQALKGSLWSLGWDSTNFEGAAASSILTGNTYMVTLDGLTNVDAATNNVLFVGIAIDLPATSSASTRAIVITSVQTGAASSGIEVTMTPGSAATVRGATFTLAANATGYGIDIEHNGGTAGTQSVALRLGGSVQSAGLEFGGGTSLAVSNANEARIRYNVGSATLQVSLNGAAYVDFDTAAGDSLQTAYAAGPGIVVTAANPMTIANAAGVTSNLLSLTDSTIASNANVGLTWTRNAVPTGATTWTGRAISIQNTPTGTNSFSDSSSGLILVNHAPVAGAGTITDTTTGLAITMTPAAASAVIGQSVTMASTTSSSGSLARWIWNSAAGTNGITNNAICNIYTNFNGNSAVLTFLSISSRTASLTPTGTVHGIQVDLATNVASSSQTVRGAYILLPQTSGFGSGVEVSSVATLCYGFVFSMPSAVTATGEFRGVHIDLVSNFTPNGQSIIGVNASAGSTSNSASTSSAAGYFDWRGRAGHATHYGALSVVSGGAVTTTGAWTMINTSFAAAATLGAALTGLNVDLSTNVTPGAQPVTGVSITIPASSSASTSAVSIATTQTRGTIHAITATGTLTAAQTGMSIDMSGVTGGSQQITGLFVDIPATTAALSGTAAGVRLRSRATNQACLLVDHANIGNYVVLIQNEGAAVTPTAALWSLYIDGYQAYNSSSVECHGLEIAGYQSSSASSTILSLNYFQTAGIIQKVYCGFTGVTLSGAFTGISLDLSTGVTPGAQAVTGISITIPATTAAAANGQGAVVINSSATLGRTFDCAIRITQGIFFVQQYLVATTLTDTVYGFNIDFNSNITPGANAVVPIAINGPATTRASTSGEASGISIVSRATRMRVIDCIVSNTGAADGIWRMYYLSGTTLSAAITGLSLDLSTNVTHGSQVMTGIAITLPASDQAATAGLSITSTQTGAASSGIVVTMSATGNVSPRGMTITMGATTNGNASGVVVASSMEAGSAISLGIANKVGSAFILGHNANVTSTGNIILMEVGPQSGSTLTLGAGVIGLEMDLSTTGGITASTFLVQGISVAIAASSHASSCGITVSSTQTGAASSGIVVAMTPGSSASVKGIQLTLGANATGAAISVAHSGSGAGILFTTGDGGAGHVAGPTNASLVIKATAPAVAGTSTAGNGVTITASPAIAGNVTAGAAAGGGITITAGDAARLTSGDANGGDISLVTGAAIGAGTHGRVNFDQDNIALGGGAAPTFGTIGGSGPATAGQNMWLAVKIGGTLSFLPVWR